MNVKTVTNQFCLMYIVYTVHCFVYQNPKVPKWRRVGSSKIYFPYLDSSEGGFKNSICLKTREVAKILPLDVSPQGPPCTINNEQSLR